MKRLGLLFLFIFLLTGCGEDPKESSSKNFGWPNNAVLTGSDPSVCGIDLSWPGANLAAGYRVYHGEKLVEQIKKPGYFVRALPLGESVTLSVEAYSATGEVSERLSLTDTIPGTLPEFNFPVPKPGLPGQFYNKVSFLFTGDQPYQCDCDVDQLEMKMISVIRGKISDRDGKPIQNVAVSIAGKREYGFSYSRENGWFDLAVNGDEELTIDYKKDGYIPIQRKITPKINRYDFVDDVVMIQLDQNKAVIDLKSSNGIQVARGSEITDQDGTRQTTMLFKPGTKVNLTYKDGRKVALDQITVRATEFTVGDNGPAAMPGSLPDTSGYTYAVELSADEVFDAGGKTVTFDQPVYTYVDNFLKFPAGTIVPNGYYDYDKKRWLADRNGLVITVLSNEGGKATVDVDGDGAADEGEKLTNLGFNEDELRKLATLYPDGKSLWRVPITHFSPHDFNWPYKCDGECEPPPAIKEHPCDKYYKKFYHNIIVAPAPGGSNLNYCSMNGSYEKTRKGRTEVKGNGYIAKINLIGAHIPKKLKWVYLIIEIAGQKHEYHYFKELPPYIIRTNLVHEFEWNGEDQDGNKVTGKQEAVIKIGYGFGTKYGEPDESDFSFGLDSDGMEYSTMSREKAFKWREETVLMGADDILNQKNNGWNIEGFHRYDPASSYLHLGSGDSVKATPLESAKWEKRPYKRIDYGSGSGSYVPAMFTILSDETIATTDALYGGFMFFFPDGTYKEFHPSLPGNFVVTKILHDQEDRVYFTGMDLSLQNSCPAIYSLDSDGNIEHLAGDTNGEIFPNGVKDGANALKTCLNTNKLTISPGGEIYFVESFSAYSRIHQIKDGKIINIGGVEGGSPANYIPAKEAFILDIGELTFDQDGSLYFYEETVKKIRKIDPEGMISTVIDGTHSVFKHIAEVNNFKAMGGILYFKDDCERLFQVKKGHLNHIGGCKESPVNGCSWECYLGESIEDFEILEPEKLLVMTQGFNELTFSEIVPVPFKIEDTLPPSPADDENNPLFSYFVPSKTGSVIYQFDQDGKHLRTIDAMHGTVLATFRYNLENLLIKKIDQDGNETIFERGPDGWLDKIIDHHGNWVEFRRNQHNWLSKVTYPGGIEIEYEYDPVRYGLLKKVINPRKKVTEYEYDHEDRLIKTTDAAGGFVSVEYEPYSLEGNKITWSTAEGAISSEVQQKFANTITQKNTAQQCTKTVTYNDDEVIIDHPTGVKETLTQGNDPRFGENHKFTKKIKTEFPGGRVVTVENDIQYDLDGDNPLKVNAITTKSKLNNKQESIRHYDVKTGELTVTSPMGLKSTTNYNDEGRVSQTSVPGFYPTQYVYDDNGRLVEMTQHERSVRYAYNEKGYLESVTDHTGRKTEYTYDPAGRVIETKLPDGHVVGKKFDDNSNVTEIDPTNPYGYSYTDVDQVDTYTEPSVDGKTYQTKYIYDLDGAVTSVTRPDKSEITYQYEDTTRRLKQVNTADGAVVYDYDSDTGLLTSVTFGDESVSYVYDGSLTTSESVSGAVDGTVSWSYNQELLVDQITVNNNSVSYEFNDDGALTKAGDVSLSYNDTTGQLMGITQGDFKEDYTFTMYGELESYTITQSGSVIYKEELVYDEVGRIETNRITRGGESYVEKYQYDLRGRLEKVFKDDVEQVSYTFDNNSNRLTETKGGETVSGIYDEQDRLLGYGDLSFTYTDNGDLKTKVHGSGVDTYHYDAFGNMRQVDLADGRVITYKMDARDRRVAKLVDGVVTQRMIYKDQLNPIAILDAQNNVETLFVYGSKSNVPNYMVKGGEQYKYITDHKGSVLQVIKMGDGSVVQEISYDYWGNVLSDSNPGFQPFYYVGGLYDPDTKLVKFGVRSYDPEVGRWLQKEPLGFAGALNFYAYCEGEPVNWVDVTGLKTKIWVWHPSTNSVSSIFGHVNISINGAMYDFTLTDTIVYNEVEYVLKQKRDATVIMLDLTPREEAGFIYQWYKMHNGRSYNLNTYNCIDATMNPLFKTLGNTRGTAGYRRPDWLMPMAFLKIFLPQTNLKYRTYFRPYKSHSK